jgi:2,3-bisphosphoglycerate-independent phosphoglycerate mutase
MDRDSRWERIEKSYRMYIYGEGEKHLDSNSAIQTAYDNKITDEFILPAIIGEPALIQDKDAVLMMNFRADRMRQIVTAINDPVFSQFKTESLNILFTCMTKYQANFPYPVLFESETIKNIFPEILANNNYRQLRIAETEKYAHVTYFFNGGNEKTFQGESRRLIPSPKVATYDLQPEMSAPEVTEEVLSAISGNEYEAIIINFANPDMVGHTGNMAAAIKAIETIDSCLGKIRSRVKESCGVIFLTADHGNLEMMINSETGQIHTAHTTLPVPFIMDDFIGNYYLERTGKLADIAPTILDYLNISKPDEMTGQSLLINSHE